MQFCGQQQSKCTIFSFDLLRTNAIFYHQDRQLFLMITCPWMRYATYIHRDRQLSWWFMLLNKIQNTYGWIFCIFKVTYKITGSNQSTQHPFLSPKQQKSKIAQNHLTPQLHDSNNIDSVIIEDSQGQDNHRQCQYWGFMKTEPCHVQCVIIEDLHSLDTAM